MFQKVDDISVMGLAGELDGDRGSLLLKEIENLIRFEWNKIVLDLRKVEHIHLRFLRDLLFLAFRAKTSTLGPGAIKLANVSSYAKKILMISGVDRFFETYDSVAEAVLSFDDYPEASSLLQ